jgi:hypothetical protein
VGQQEIGRGVGRAEITSLRSAASLRSDVALPYLQLPGTAAPGPAGATTHIIGTPPTHSGSMVAITREDLQGALPDVTSTLTAAGLDGAVTIMRDQYGVPRACVPACCGSRCQARAHSLALLRA